MKEGGCAYTRMRQSLFSHKREGCSLPGLSPKVLSWKTSHEREDLSVPGEARDRRGTVASLTWQTLGRQAMKEGARAFHGKGVTTSMAWPTRYCLALGRPAIEEGVQFQQSDFPGPIWSWESQLLERGQRSPMEEGVQLPQVAQQALFSPGETREEESIVSPACTVLERPAMEE